MKPLTMYKHRAAIKEPQILLQQTIQLKVTQLKQAAEMQLRSREPGASHLFHHAVSHKQSKHSPHKLSCMRLCLAHVTIPENCP